MLTPTQLRSAAAEVSLGFSGLLLGYALVFVAIALGLWPQAGPLGRSIGLVAGPAITGIAAAMYAGLARQLDASGRPGDARVSRVGHDKARPVMSVAYVALGVVLALGGSAVLGLVMDMLGAPVTEQAGIRAIVDAARGGEGRVELAVLVASAVALAPLAEEWLFRGLLFARLGPRVGWPVAYGASAVAFAIIHANLGGLVVYLWLGCVFAWIYARTGRLWTAMAVHMGNNAFALALLISA